MPDKYFRPLDVNKFREIIQQESARMNLRSYSIEGETSFTLALALTAAVKKIFYEKSSMTFSSEPELKKKLITQFANRMRVDAMEKFNTTTVFSVVELAADDQGLEHKEYMVTLIVYLELKFLPEFLRLMQYPYIDSDEEIEVKDGCGALVNLIAGQYKKELAALGYKDLMMSHFESFINTSPDGVGIPKGLTEKFEISFELEDSKCLVVEVVTLNMLPKRKLLEKQQPKKILIIDDDWTFIKTIEPLLRSQGHIIIVANDGEEGLKRLKEKPHLIILDVMMPIMGGYEFIVEMKKIEGTDQIPVIVLTSKDDMADIFKVEGVREYLLKPIQPMTLLKSIQRCI